MKKIAFIFIISLLLASCKEEAGHGPTAVGVTPPPLTQYTVHSFAGAVEIEFQIPDKENTMYVMAEYLLPNGELKNVKASKYSNKLRLEGFEKAARYDVTLYAVGEGEQRSEPLHISVEPLTPPYQEAFNSLYVGPSWGGITASYTNPSKTDLMLEIIRKNDKGEWEVIERNSSNQEQVKFNPRGYANEENIYGFYIRDRWMNYSDTLFEAITPYFEELLDMKNLYVETCLPTDQCVGNMTGATRRIYNLFDGLFTQQTSWYTPSGTGIPVHFTISLGGGTWQLSRLKLWQRPGSTYAYQAANVRNFDVYGSTDPNPDGSWDSWTLLSTFENVKPSGLPGLAELSALDLSTAEAGENYDFPLDIPPVKFIRIDVTQTWGLTNYMYIIEMEIYGSKIN
jgi:hypothetical protein